MRLYLNQLSTSSKATRHDAVADGSSTQITTADQRDFERESRGDGGRDRTLHNHVHASDTLQFDANFNITGHSGSKTTQTYRAFDFSGACYSRTLTAVTQVLTDVQNGRGCEDGGLGY